MLANSGFDLSFRNAAIKIYPFATFCWVDDDENMWPNISYLAIGQGHVHKHEAALWTLEKLGKTKRIEILRKHVF